MSILLEPFFVYSVVRHGNVNPVPKAIGVVELYQVGKLVDDDVVNDLPRRQQQPRAEVYVAGIGAGSPVAVVVLKPDAFDGPPQLLAKVSGSKLVGSLVKKRGVYVCQQLAEQAADGKLAVIARQVPADAQVDVIAD